MIFKKKISARRKQVRENISAEKVGRLGDLIDSGIPVSLLILLGFGALTVGLFSIDAKNGILGWKSSVDILCLGGIVSLICIGMGFYVYYYRKHVMRQHLRGMALCSMFLIFLTVVRLGTLFHGWYYLASGTAVMSAIILTISYDQRFALGMSFFYSVLACFAFGGSAGVDLFLIMMSGVFMCCFSLGEIRTRTKLIEVSMWASIAVFLSAICVGFLGGEVWSKSVFNAGSCAGVTFAVGVLMQALLPIIEKVFGIATSMTLLDYSDANQPLLRKLAMEAPGTYSHCLLIGSVAEAGAESIGANGLLCRVGAYYHDIGKINKPKYFVENQMGSASRHETLSPAMSQMIIVGHVKDGMELAKEYGVPAVIRQFIETHHGTTLVEYFYHEAKKQENGKGSVSESEFRYPGPKPWTKEAAILMLADSVEGAVRSLPEVNPTKIETVVHNMAMKRLQDSQFDDCELTLRELSQIESSISKSLAAHYHGRIAYPKRPDEPVMPGGGLK